MKKLKLLLAFCALLLGWSNASAYQTPVADGVYYLFNTGVTDGGSGFISRGENYAKRGVIDKYGIPFKLVSTGTADTYYFQLYDTDLWLSDDGFMYTDGGTDRRRAIKVESQGEGIYKLINTNNSKEVENWYGHPVGDGTGNRRDYLWQFYSIEEYEAVVAGYTSTEKSTIATTMGWDLSGTNFDSYLSTNYVGIDKTSLIEHATFDTEHSTSGWTITPNDNSSMSIGWGNEGGDKITPEFYQGYGTISQTVTVPSAGLYKVSVNAFARNANYERFHSAGAVSSVSYLKANDNKVRLCDIYSNGEVTSNFPGGPNAANNNFFSQGKYLNEVYVYVTDASKQITITLGNPSATGGCWMVFNNFKLTYYSDEVSEEDATAILNQANALANVDMLGTIKTALTDAKNTFDGARTIANYNALSTAIDNANTSKNAYANAKAYLDGAATVLEGTNVYTTSAYASYYSEPKAKYDAKTLTNEEANALTPTSTGWHSANTIDDILLSAWTIGGEQCKDFDKALYINTWSVEGNTDGSNFLTPFFEYWVADAQSLGANTLQATVTGLKASTTYSFTIRARVRQTDGQTKIANGITMKVGEGEAVDISSGAQFGTGQFYIGNFSAVGQTDEDGKLVTTITVAENSNISWLSFYNAKYTEGEDLSAYIADYEFALANAQAAQSKPMDLTKKSALDAAVSTNGSLTTATATKQELIDAKEALEAALANVTPSIAALAGTSVADWTTKGNNGTFRVNTWSNEGNTDGSNMTTPFVENWIDKNANTPLTDVIMSYTMTGQTPGYYKVQALVRSLNEKGGATPAGTFIFANDAIERAYNGTSCTNGVYDTPTVYGLVSEDGQLTIGVKVIKSNVNFLAFKNFSIEYLGTELTSTIADNQTEEARTFVNNTTAQAAQDEAVSALETLSDANYSAAGVAIENAYKAIDRDFSGLQAAIDAKASAVLGFETGEYAPYNLVAPLAAANAIDQNSETSSQSDINAAATALNNVSANVGEVNAIYWDYSALEETNDRIEAKGWYDPAVQNQGAYYCTRIVNNKTTNTGLTAVDGGYALFTKQHSHYGDVDGYTLPLKASRTYKLKFKYAGWGNEPSTTSIYLTDDEGNNRLDISGTFVVSSEDAKNGNSHPEAWVEYTGYFAVPATGNYVLYLNRNDYTGSNQRQVVMGSIDLRTAEYLEFADGSVPTYAPGTYPSVKISRSLTANRWATAVYPFAISKTDVGNIAVLDSYNSSTGIIGFTSAATSTANVPFLMMSESAKSEITLSNVAVAAASVDNATADEAFLIGAYAATDITNAEKNYVLSDNKIFSVGDAGATINPYRAYIQLAEEGSLARALRFVVDGQITGVDNVAAAEASAEVKDGKYIENGKVVIVKNGKKFNANGQQVK